MKNRFISYPVLVILAAIISIFQSTAAAAGNSADVKIVQVRSAWSADRAHPGDSIVLAVVVDIEEGYHINADAHQVKAFGDFKPYPTKLAVIAADAGMTIESPRYPAAVPLKVQYADRPLPSFKGRTIIYLPVKLEDTLPPGISGIKLQFEYQACAENYCLFPQKMAIEETLTVVNKAGRFKNQSGTVCRLFRSARSRSAPQSVDFDLFGWGFSIDASSGFGLVLLLITAAFGGLLLNFTPCVLPLIPIKIISLSNAAQNRQRCLMLGLTMFLGVLAFWLALGVMIALVSGFSATNQLFQYPAFTILVGIIIAAMATGMFGFFSVRLPNFIYMINPEQDTLHGSFGLGILAAILSTPCTAPFMGAAAAWAATQTPGHNPLYFRRHRHWHGPSLSGAFGLTGAGQKNAENRTGQHTDKAGNGACSCSLQQPILSAWVLRPCLSARRIRPADCTGGRSCCWSSPRAAGWRIEPFRLHPAKK